MYSVNMRVPPLRPEFKEAWVSALRSGDYTQTKRFLCRVSKGNTSFCCLGVGTTIVGILPGEVIDTPSWATLPEYTRERDKHILLHFYTTLPRLDLGEEINPSFVIFVDNEEPLSIHLTNLNDEGFTFDQIADVIDYFF